MTQDKTIEAVARALEPTIWKYIDAWGEALKPLSHHLEQKRVYSMVMALNAITAHTACLMEPERKMLFAGSEAIYGQTTAAGRDDAYKCWKAMLSAKEKT